MPGLLKKIDEKFEETLMGLFLVAISCIILLQIVMRLMKMSLSWPEELARYMYVWSVFLSLACTVRNRTALRVDLVIHLFPEKLKKVAETLLPLLDAAFFLTLFHHSLRVITAVKMSNQTSPALEIPMYLVYLIVPAGFFLAGLRALQQLYLRLRDLRSKNAGDSAAPLPGA